VNEVNFLFGASQSSEFFAKQKRGEAFLISFGKFRRKFSFFYFKKEREKSLDFGGDFSPLCFLYIF